MKKVPAVLAGTFLLFSTFINPPLAIAVVPTPDFLLVASPSKVNGSAWTNDGLLGGSATLAAATSTLPAFQSSDTSVALNATSSHSQYINGTLTNTSALTNVTFEIQMKIPSLQQYGASTSGMILGWAGNSYDVWLNGNCIGFNTGGGEVFGINNSANYGAFHTYTFVMSTYADNTTRQRIFIDGVAQTLGACQAGTISQANKIMGSATNATFAIGRYGSNAFYGTFNIRKFKLWTSDIGNAAILESYNSQFPPTSHTIALTSGLSNAVYRAASTLRSSTDVDGKVTFFFNGKRIPNCINIQTVSKVANCTWRPAAIGYNNLTAQLVAAGGSLTTSTFRVFVAKRSGNR